MSATIHDIGKIMIPAEILSRPTKLTELVRNVIETHVNVGYEAIKEARFMHSIAEIVYQHHERLDGSGYPRGLKADEMLLEARILAVADVVEAMSFHRPYIDPPWALKLHSRRLRGGKEPSMTRQ